MDDLSEECAKAEFKEIKLRNTMSNGMLVSTYLVVTKSSSDLARMWREGRSSS